MNTSTDRLVQSLSKAYHTEDLRGVLEKIEAARQDELEQLERRYREIVMDKDKQHKEFLEEIDQLMLEQENEISDLKQKNDYLQLQFHDLSQERNYLRQALEAEKISKGSLSVWEGERARLLAAVDNLV